MPRLPQAGFTARTRQVRPPGFSGGRRATGADFGALEGAALQQVGQTIGQVGEAFTRAKEQQEVRDLQLRSAKMAVAFREELEAAVQEGADFEQLQEQWNERFAQLSEEVETQSGFDTAQQLAAEAELFTAERIRTAHAERVRLTTQAEVTEFESVLGREVFNAPDQLPTALENLSDMLDTFDLSPEEKRAAFNESANALALAAGNGLLQDDPGRLKALLEEGEGVPHLTPGQVAQFVAKADNAIAKLERERETKDDMAQLLTRQALDAAAEDHVLSNEEAPEWFGAGVTVSQFHAAQNKSIQFEAERQQLAADAGRVRQGSAASLSKARYQAAIDAIVADTVEGLDEASATDTALNLRVLLANRNGRSDQMLAKHLNAGAAGGDLALRQSLEIRRRMRNLSPQLYNEMVTDGARKAYNAYDTMVDGLGLTHEAALQELATVRERMPDMDKALNSPANRERIQDAVENLVDEGDAISQVRVLRRSVEDRAMAYLALFPLMTDEQAVENAAADIEETTVEINGFRVSGRGVPPRHDEADTYVRRIVLKRELEEAFPGREVGVLETDKLILYPNGDGTAAVINPESGTTVFPAFNWTRAVAEWWDERGRESDEFKAERAERRSRRAQERRAREAAQPPLEGAEF